MARGSRACPRRAAHVPSQRVGTPAWLPSTVCTARTSRSRRAACSSTPARRRPRASARRCPPTTSRRGASARGSPASRSPSSARRWSRRPCRGGWSARPGSGTTRRSSRRRSRRWPSSRPGRLWVALGTGEASNEHITGEPWPSKRTRTERLRECVDVMRALLAGEVVDHDGLVRVDRAKLWTLPADPPALVGAAVSEETARWCGGWADGLVTVNQPRDKLERMIAAFREGGGDGKPVHLQVHLSWAPDEDEALAIAHDQWRTNLFQPPLCWDLHTVEQFDEAARHVRRRTCTPASCLSRPGPARGLAGGARRARLRADHAPPRRAGPLPLHRRVRLSRAPGAGGMSPSAAARRRATCGGRTRSSTASTSSPSTTPTATAAATSPDSASGSTTWPGSASPACG